MKNNIAGQLSLFNDGTCTETETICGLKVYEGGNTNDRAGGNKNPGSCNLLKCRKIELRGVEYMSLEDLFKGFDTIKVITFSYDIGFINQIMGLFKYGEIILGANFMVEKDAKISGILAGAQMAKNAVKSYPNLMKMAADESVVFRTPKFVMDHRKLYLLKADDGRTRVVTGTANMSNGAWNGSHMEDYLYDDTEDAYYSYVEDFETQWENSVDIPYKILSSKKTDDVIEDNPIISELKKVGKIVLFRQPKNEYSINQIQYVIDCEKLKDEYDVITKKAGKNQKGEVTELFAKDLEIMERNNKERISSQKVETNTVTKNYPSMTFDFNKKEAMLDEKMMDLNPEKEEVTNDIDNMLSLYKNFDAFLGDSRKLKETHFKLMNAIFASPFEAKMRCVSDKKDVNIPGAMFIMISSKSSNCGKTFMVSAALKMMTGKKITVFNRADCKKETINMMQQGGKGVPVFVDEIDGRFFGNALKDIIKNQESCEKYNRAEQPVLIFASNDIIDPEDYIRKRMVFLKFDGTIPSSIDQVAYNGIGKKIVKNLGTGFYREYLGRMLQKVSEEIHYILESDNIPSEYYTDLMKMSSETIVEIFDDYGYILPEYIKVLNWNDDYAANAKHISEDIFDEIRERYNRDKKCIEFRKDELIIDVGNDKDSVNKCKSWENSLPKEMFPKSDTRSGAKLIVNRKEFEKRLKLKPSVFRR